MYSADSSQEYYTNGVLLQSREKTGSKVQALRLKPYKEYIQPCRRHKWRDDNTQRLRRRAQEKPTAVLMLGAFLFIYPLQHG